MKAVKSIRNITRTGNTLTLAVTLQVHCLGWPENGACVIEADKADNSITVRKA